MRRLALHASALSDAEYELYTASLRDIADDSTSHGAGKGVGAGVEDDTYYENMHVGVREARAWLRGRYTGVPASLIDGIIKFFSPTLGHGDTLSGSEFFAAIRLAMHAENGGLKEVDRSLAFVQAVPLSSGDKLPPQTLGAPPPPMPSRRPFTESSISFTSSSKSSTTARAPNLMTHNLLAIPDPSSPQRSESSESVSGSISASQHPLYNPFMSRSPRSENGIRSSRLPPLTQAASAPPVPDPPNKICITNTTHNPSTNTTIVTTTNTSTTTTTTTISPPINLKPL